MAPEDERDLIEAVVTCEGNLHDPDFSTRFQTLVDKLKGLLYTSRTKEQFKVRKIEPWNSVRVTISIPKEAAQRLQLLAQQGSSFLSDLGILSVQVEGDQVISLTLAGRSNNEPSQEVLLRSTSNDDASCSSFSSSSSLFSSSSLSVAAVGDTSPQPIAGPSGLSVPLGILSSSDASAFRSPNVVAPSGESIPAPPKNHATGLPPGVAYPFASMTHAAQATHVRPDGCPPTSNFSTNIPSPNQPKAAASLTLVNPTNPSVLVSQSRGLTGCVSSGNVTRFVFNNNNVSSTSSQPNQSQSLQFQLLNAPPPYPGLSNTPVATLSQLSSTSPLNNSLGNIVGVKVGLSGAVAGKVDAVLSADKQPLASPLLVNLLQNSDGSAGIMRIPTNCASESSMLPPGVDVNPKQQRYLQQQKKKRGLSLDAASPSAVQPAILASAGGTLSEPASPDAFQFTSPSEPVNVGISLHQKNIRSDQSTIVQSSVRTVPVPNNYRFVNSVSAQLSPIRAARMSGQLANQQQMNLRSSVPHSLVNGPTPLVETSVAEVPTKSSSTIIWSQRPGMASAINDAELDQAQLYGTFRTPIESVPICKSTKSHVQSSGQPLGEAKSSASHVSHPSATLRQSGNEPTAPPTSVSSIPAQLTSTGKPRQFLINPLTGHLEPMPSESSSESEGEDGDQINAIAHGGKGPRAPVPRVSSGEDTVLPLLKGAMLQQLPKAVTTIPVTVGPNIRKSRDEFTDLTSGSLAKDIKEKDPISTSGGEKIKLRLKLGKNEPITPAYRVDLSFVKKSEKAAISQTIASVSQAPSQPVPQITASDQPRVPPLHISLRGRNAAVVVSPRRDDKDCGSSGLPGVTSKGVSVTNDTGVSLTSPSIQVAGTIVQPNCVSKAPKRTKVRLKNEEIDTGESSVTKHVKSRPRSSKELPSLKKTSNSTLQSEPSDVKDNPIKRSGEDTSTESALLKANHDLISSTHKSQSQADVVMIRKELLFTTDNEERPLEPIEKQVSVLSNVDSVGWNNTESVVVANCDITEKGSQVLTDKRTPVTVLNAFVSKEKLSPSEIPRLRVEMPPDIPKNEPGESHVPSLTVSAIPEGKLKSPSKPLPKLLALPFSAIEKVVDASSPPPNSLSRPEVTDNKLSKPSLTSSPTTELVNVKQVQSQSLQLQSQSPHLLSQLLSERFQSAGGNIPDASVSGVTATILERTCTSGSSDVMPVVQASNEQLDHSVLHNKTEEILKVAIPQGTEKQESIKMGTFNVESQENASSVRLLSKQKAPSPVEPDSKCSFSKESTTSEPSVSHPPPIPVLPSVPSKTEEGNGATGEDSGIDSMDALSEKSPNQGESPARKEADAFCDNVAPVVSSKELNMLSEGDGTTKYVDASQSTNSKQAKEETVVISKATELKDKTLKSEEISSGITSRIALVPSTISSETNASNTVLVSSIKSCHQVIKESATLSAIKTTSANLAVAKNSPMLSATADGNLCNTPLNKNMQLSHNEEELCASKSSTIKPVLLASSIVRQQSSTSQSLTSGQLDVARTCIVKAQVKEAPKNVDMSVSTEEMCKPKTSLKVAASSDLVPPPPELVRKGLILSPTESAILRSSGVWREVRAEPKESLTPSLQNDENSTSLNLSNVKTTGPSQKTQIIEKSPTESVAQEDKPNLVQDKPIKRGIDAISAALQGRAAAAASRLVTNQPSSGSSHVENQSTVAGEVSTTADLTKVPVTEKAFSVPITVRLPETTKLVKSVTNVEAKVAEKVAVTKLTSVHVKDEDLKVKLQAKEGNQSGKLSNVVLRGVPQPSIGVNMPVVASAEASEEIDSKLEDMPQPPVLQKEDVIISKRQPLAMPVLVQASKPDQPSVKLISTKTNIAANIVDGKKPTTQRPQCVKNDMPVRNLSVTVLPISCIPKNQGQITEKVSKPPAKRVKLSQLVQVQKSNPQESLPSPIPPTPDINKKIEQKSQDVPISIVLPDLRARSPPRLQRQLVQTIQNRMRKSQSDNVTPPKLLKVTDTSMLGQLEHVKIDVASLQAVRSQAPNITGPTNINVSMARALPNMIQLSNINKLPIMTSSSGGPVGSGGQTVFAIHPNVNLPANLSQHMHSSTAFTVLQGGGHKMVPIKLVTIPKQATATTSRSSPILEAVNLVTAANASGRALSPNPKSGQASQTTPLNLSSVPSGVHIVPISVGTTGAVTANPVKVIVSSPMKSLQPSVLQSMVMKSVMVANPQSSIRVVRPIEPQLHAQLQAAATLSAASAVRNVSTITISPSVPQSQKPANPISSRANDVQVLDAEVEEEEDLPFEADIIHDEKDLEDVLAAEHNELITENGIEGSEGSHEDEHDPAYFSEQDHSSVSGSTTKNKYKVKGALVNTSETPVCHVRPTRSSAPVLNSCETDVHGEDQEIIDTLALSPSQPKLSPQNKPLPEKILHGSPTKPDLIRTDEPYIGNFGDPDLDCKSEAPKLHQELTIEIPPADLMVTCPSVTHEERKTTRSTRSNTRLPSPDIIAYRMVDTPKPHKFTSKPDSVVIRNSPKPSPTGSLKMLSPTVSNLSSTPSSSTRSSPVQPGLGGTTPVNAAAVVATVYSRVAKGTTTGKRKRQESDSSSASKDENSEEKIEIDLNSRPGKRRCSENAAELIKACIGVEDTPKRNTSLIKKMEEAKNKETKMRKMTTLMEEKEDDDDDPVLRGKSGRTSRGSSEDRSSSRGSSTHRATIVPSPRGSIKDEDITKETKSGNRLNNRVYKEGVGKNVLSLAAGEGVHHNITPNSTKKESGRRSNRGALSKEKSPLTPKTRTNVRKEPTPTSIGEKAMTPSTSPENENPRRKTRSSVAVGVQDSELPTFKRRRISKDAKS